MSKEATTELISLLQAVEKGKPFIIKKQSSHSAKVKAWGMGVLRNYFFYTYCTNKFLRKNSSNELKHFLMISMFRLDDNEKDSARLVNAIVEDAKKQHLPVGLVNAVLRRYTLNKDKLLITTRGDATIQYNIRPSLLKMIKEGHENWRDIIHYLKQPSLVCLYLQKEKSALTQFIENLDDINHEKLPCGVALQDPPPIQSIHGYNDGGFTVMSDSNQQLESILPNTSPKNILDACAAPGGKSLILRNKYGKAPTILATDVDIDRITRLKENNDRLHLNLNIQTIDWTTAIQDQQFDLIWADVPCSATGVMSKHPEIMIQQREDLQNTPIQQQLLKNLWQHLSKGGTLIYSTCSILREENDGQVQRFITEHSNASLIPIKGSQDIPSALGAYFTSPYSHDIIFCSLIKKR